MNLPDSPKTSGPTIDRRAMLQRAVLAAPTLLAPTLIPASAIATVQETPSVDSDHSLAGRLYKTLKIGMIRIEGGLAEKFKAAKSAGFQGVELSAPGVNVAETRDAIAQSGLPVDGVVCAGHWQIRHTSADAAERRGRWTA